MYTTTETIVTLSGAHTVGFSRVHKESPTSLGMYTASSYHFILTVRVPLYHAVSVCVAITWLLLLKKYVCAASVLFNSFNTRYLCLLYYLKHSFTGIGPLSNTPFEFNGEYFSEVINGLRPQGLNGVSGWFSEYIILLKVYNTSLVTVAACSMQSSARGVLVYVLSAC
jgi:hypothetical protein